MTGVASTIAAESLDTFTEEELRAMIETAHGLGVKVAAHTSGSRTWDRLTGKTDSAVQMDSVEHAYGIHHQVAASVSGGEVQDDTGSASASGFSEISKYGGRLSSLSRMTTTWVPTLGAYYTLGQNTGLWKEAAESFKKMVQHAESSHIKIACGGDTGVFAHGDNALEMKLMVRLGANWRHVLKWGTLGGWECIRSLRWEGEDGARRLANVGELGEDARVVGDNEVPFGVIKRGFAADIIATDGDLEKDFERAVDKRSIMFVMKGGRIYKRGGREAELE